MLLLIDNYDSFTFNLSRYFEELGQEVAVFRNDEISVEEAESLRPEYLVISPGPKDPVHAGISMQAIKHFAGKVPTLGVCLGHQAIGEVFGAKVIRANKVMHGKVSKVEHSGQSIMRDIPSPFNVTRYHSLVLEEKSLPSTIKILAKTADENPKNQEIMAIAHTELPIYGVQFHPESLLTEYGHQVLRNFLTLKDTKRYN